MINLLIIIFHTYQVKQCQTLSKMSRNFVVFFSLSSHIVLLLWLPDLTAKMYAPQDEDPGFELYVGMSNLQEIENHILQFIHPLPTWLKGTLVRFITYLVSFKSTAATYDVK